MVFDITLYISLTIFLAGMIYRLSAWFRTSVGFSPGDMPTSKRVAAAIRGCLFTIMSPKIVPLIKVFVVDIVLQFRMLKDRKDFLVWMLHLFIYGGFILLLLMHALDGLITSRLFSNYYPTINPFLFLRNGFGAIVLIGLIMAAIRRVCLKKPGLTTQAADVFAIVILFIITVSGFLMEGTQITSFTAYEEMVEEYASFQSKEEARALETFWVKEFALVSPNRQTDSDPEMLSLGKQLNDTSCAECHSSPKWAFVSYAVAKVTRPAALQLDGSNIPSVLWYVHFLACFFGLAYLPFSKMFHMFATPASILVNTIVEEAISEPANVATKLRIELDGCKHGGTCHPGCPVHKKRESELASMTRTEPFLQYLNANLRIKS